MIDTILKAFDHKPNSQEWEDAKVECSKLLDIKECNIYELYLQYDENINSWLLRIKYDEPKLD